MFDDRQLVDLLPALMRIAMKLTKNRHRAEDLVQDTTVRMLSNRDKFETGSRLEAWAYTIMRNLHRNSFRSVLDVVDIERVVDTLASVDERADRDAVIDLQTAWSVLTQREAAIMARVVAGDTYDEICDVLQIHLGTVKSRISRARDKLMAVTQ